jgi:uncharacterized membrane protein YfcA
MITDPWFYAAAVPALLLTGFSKSGFVAGSGAISVPILCLVIPPVQAVGIMLPILLVADLVGITTYWRQKHELNFRILLVAGVAGSLAGWATAALISEAWVRLMVGVIGTLFALDWWLGLRPTPKSAPGPSWPRGLAWGTISAYTSFISQTAGPPLAVYLMPQRLPTTTYAATAVCFLTCINWMKVVPYFLLGQLGPENLMTSAVLMPMALAFTLLGLWLVRRIPPGPFYKIGYAALLVVSLKLTWDGAIASLGS